MEKKYRIGLDIGIASVGWCVVECDENGEPIRIAALGSRVFDGAEVPKTGAALAEARRNARGSRRRLRRKRARLDEIVNLFKKNGVEVNFSGEDVYSLRVKALDCLISENDFAKVLYLLAKRRGFKSNSKSADASDKEGGKLLKAANENEKALQDGGYRTVGEMLYNMYACEERSAAGCVVRINARNKGGDYKKTVYRADVEKEIKLLFEKQRAFGNKLAANEIEERYLELFARQRNFDEGPGQGSPYTAEFNVGWCPFSNKTEKRAPKASYSFEYATALQKLNNLTIIGEDGSRALTEDERRTLLKLINDKTEVTYHDVRKALSQSLKDEDRFNISYSVPRKKTTKKTEKAVVDESKSATEIEKKTLLSTMKRSSAIASKLSEVNKTPNMIDAVAVVLSTAKSDEKRRSAFEGGELTAKLSAEEIDNLLPLNCDKFGLLGLSALRNIIPFLEDGQKYSEACASAGYKTSAGGCEKTKQLNTPEIYAEVGEIASPVVKRSVSQTLKVLNAIINKYGSPIAVNVELAREMSKSFDERRKAESNIKANFEEKERARAEFRSKFGREASGDSILRYRLYEEQNSQCVYSGKAIDLDRLFDNNYYQIDHVMPYSRSFNNSYNNKVLVLTDENQRKGNRTPYEYMDEEKYARFAARVNANVNYGRNPNKKSNLLRKSLNEEEMKSRALNDTRYISRFVSELLSDHLLFDTSALKKKRVFVYNGVMTDYVRRQWGIVKIREDGDLHHAVDAAVIACMTDGMRQKIERYHKTKETRWIGGMQVDLRTGEDVSTMNVVTSDDRLPLPYAGFRNELKGRTEDSAEERRRFLLLAGYSEEQIDESALPFVSRMPKRKVKGQLHDATVRSAKQFDNKGVVITKTALEKLKLSKDKSEIEGYYDKKSDRLLYEKLYAMLVANDGDAAKAFADPVYKPRSDGSNGSLVKSVKIEARCTDGVRLDKVQGMAANGGMIRVDVYKREGKYYCVPVYVIDAYKNELPTLAVVAGKPKSQWIEMKEEEFLFSLYQNDLVEVQHRNGIVMKKQRNVTDSRMPATLEFKKGYAYFVAFSISTAAVSLIDNSNCYEISSLGTKTLESIRKCQVDVLGNISYVGKEKLVPLTMKNPGLSCNKNKL